MQEGTRVCEGVCGEEEGDKVGTGAGETRKVVMFLKNTNEINSRFKGIGGGAGGGRNDSDGNGLGKRKDGFTEGWGGMWT